MIYIKAYKDWEFYANKIGQFTYEVTGDKKVIAYANSKEEAEAVVDSFITYLKNKEKI